MHHSVVNTQRAFSLVEMSIVLVIISVVTASALVMTDNYIAGSKREKTATKLRLIEEAITDYVKINGYLPCPASFDAPLHHAEYQLSDNCAAATPEHTAGTVNVIAVNAGTASDTTDDVWIGAVPTRTLNLPDSFGLDAWNNRIRYAVLKELAYSKQQFARYVPVLAPTLRVDDVAANAIHDRDTSFLAYVLNSHGDDSNGAISRGNALSSATVSTCNAALGDGVNCAHAPSDTTVIFRKGQYNDSDIAANYFDDVVHPVTYETLVHSVQDVPISVSNYIVRPAQKRLFTGADNGCYKDPTNILFCWGRDNNGSLGTGGGGNEDTPRNINNLTNIRTISMGQHTSCAIDDEHDVWCWGSGGRYGMIGDGVSPTVARNEPVRVDGSNGFTKAIDVAVGRYHVCAIDTDHQIWCWGANRGNSSAGTKLVNEPVVQSELRTVNEPAPVLMDLHNSLVGTPVQIAVGGRSSCIINTKHELWCWGFTVVSYSGTTTFVVVEPYHIDDMPVRAVSVNIGGGADHICALGADEKVYCFGNAGNGRLGNGLLAGGRSEVVQSLNIRGIIQLAIGNNFSCALDKSGKVWCWGRNTTHDQLGNASAPGNSATPVQVDTINDAIEIAAGQRHACARRRNQEIWCWGRNINDSLARADASINPAPINMP